MRDNGDSRLEGARKLVLTGYGHKRQTECMVEFTIELDRMLKAMGEKAFRNKTHKTRALSGQIAVTVRPTTTEK